ncbi:MAG: nuclear transport factor 2 family protein [Humibacillus sp.]|nr:nuclear transport factor 2 family protein [Humibacillus sp.]MDN5779132.1 nuclear transport factor 2 family protein [Humibacillus sp.]
MTIDHTASIQSFFRDFASASDNQDWPRYGDLFLEQFMNIDPTASAPLGREHLIAFLPRRRMIFSSVGATGTRLVDLQVESIDDRHALARTKWEVEFDHDHVPVELDTTFLLRHEDRWRIAVYLNHGSLLELLGLTASLTHEPKEQTHVRDHRPPLPQA